jgi:chromate transport protein ChrA
VSSFTFNLVAEIIIIPVTTFVMLINAFSTDKPQYVQVKKAFYALQVIIGMLILSFSLKIAVEQYKTLNGVDMLISFILPIILTFLFIPIAFLFAIYAKYELLFIHMRFQEIDNKELMLWHRKLAFQTCRLSLRKIASFDRVCAIKMFKAMTKEEFTTLVNEFRSSYKERIYNRHL